MRNHGHLAEIRRAVAQCMRDERKAGRQSPAMPPARYELEGGVELGLWLISLGTIITFLFGS